MNGEVWISTSASTCTTTPVYQTNWKLMPCVTERAFEGGIGFDPGDSVPSSANWLLGHGGDRFPLSWDSTNWPMSIYNGTTPEQMTWQWDYSSNGSGCVVQPGNEVMPLTTNLSSVTSRLQSLTAYGPTAGALGTVWTQYMLSPNWSSIWTGDATPGSYADTQTKLANGAPKLRKVAVLMTDGGFNTFRQGVTDYAADGGTQMQTVSNFAISVCNNMKANGIEIYTVGFNLNALRTGEQAIATATLQACGTDISHFYNSIDASQLDAAFKDIALKVSPVRLVQ
ncbi:MAG: hypothetical protein JSS20_20370 [Proteobacteria bacterium]|nr:hypothetical protein [Pseudomonadota bacterium]